MLESVLSFLRNDRRLEAMTLADIATTLQLVADQFADMGHRISYHGPQHAMATVRPDDLHRSITNLVENAIRFGAETTIRLIASPDHMTIEVEDDGPGISDARKAVMLEPFVRGDEARNMDEASGFGLGLSIARAIVLAHGGELSLHDRQLHGLIVRVRLPSRQSTARADRAQRLRRECVLDPAVGHRRMRPPRTDSRRRGNTRGTICAAARLQPSRGLQSACRIGRKDFRAADRQSRIAPWRISLLHVFN